MNSFNVSTQPMQVRRSIGIIFQDPSLDDRLTAEENLNLHGMIYHLPRSARRGLGRTDLRQLDRLPGLCAFPHRF